MSEASVVETSEVCGDLSRIDSESDIQSLLSEMVECVSVTVFSIVKIGAIIRRLEELEFDINSLNLPNVEYFRKVAHGSMSADVFVKFAGLPVMMRRIASLPMPDQKMLVDGKPLKVMLRGGDHLLIAANDMTTDQVRQVFASSHIRSDAEQVAWLVDRSQKCDVPAPSAVTLDRRRHGIIVGDTFISATDLAKYLGRLAER